jgi:hypothetical protein
MNTATALDKKLLAYAIAGGAAIAAPAHAGTIFVYSGPTLSTESSVNQQLNLDLDGDTVIDFSLLGAHGLLNNVVLNQINSLNNYTDSPMSAGSSVFASSMVTGINALNQGKLKEDPLPTISKQSGNFPVGVDSYIGLSFTISGQTHYGWALVNPNISSFGVVGNDSSVAELQVKGYAYQTDPGVDIFAGQTSQTPEPSTMALFALGAVGIAAAKRRKAAKA